MDVDVAASEAVPRFVDLALFLCGAVLRNLRGALPFSSLAAVRLHAWYLHHVCFLHALPNDEDGPLPSAAGAPRDGAGCGDGAAASSPCLRARLTSTNEKEGKEVNFGHALARLRSPYGTTEAQTDDTVRTVGHVHARSASSDDSAAATTSRTPSSHQPYSAASSLPLLQPPSDVGFALIRAFLHEAHQVGGAALLCTVAAALADTLREEQQQQQQQQPFTMPVAADVSVATLSHLFDSDLLDEEMSMEAGNATRGFHIWVTYEWCSASFQRQTHLAAAASQWRAALLRYGDPSLSQQAAAGLSCSPTTATLSVLPTNLRAMCSAVEGVFEGHTKTQSLLMESALSRGAPQLTDNALAKLLFLQGPSLASHLSRGELTNRGTQPILTSITSGMLLYTQYALSFHSLADARQCVRVALQVAQEVHSNAVLALAHFTAHVVAAQQGRPADAANSIAIALQLSLGTSSSGGGGDGAGEGGGAPMEGDDGQMASVAFAGAAQLLLFFPGAVSAALRSVLSTGRLTDPSTTTNTTATATTTTIAVSEQTVAQSVRHALLRAETSQLLSAPVEGRWVGVVAGLHRETLRIIAALYGVVSAPTAITTASLATMCAAVREGVAVASPLFAQHGGRTLFWEALRHAAHHALALLEHLVLAAPKTSSSARGSGATAALSSLRSALQAIRVHYGAAGVAAASSNVFFSAVVRCCAACHLADHGYTAASYALLTSVSAQLCQSSGAVDDDVSAATLCWPVDHLLLFAVVQRRRAEVAAVLGLVGTSSPAQQALLSVSSRYAFAFGVMTAQLMEAQSLQHSGRYTSALTAAHRVEQAARRIGLRSVVAAACAVQVSAHASSGAWASARCLLWRVHPRHGDLRVFVLLQKYAVHLEILLAERTVSLPDVQALTRSWLAVLARGSLLSHCGDDVPPVEGGISLSERLCLLSTVTRARQLLGCDVAVLQAETLACMRVMEARHGVAVPDVYVHGDCEEVCVRALALSSGQGL